MIIAECRKIRTNWNTCPLPNGLCRRSDWSDFCSAILVGPLSFQTTPTFRLPPQGIFTSKYQKKSKIQSMFSSYLVMSLVTFSDVFSNAWKLNEMLSQIKVRRCCILKESYGFLIFFDDSKYTHVKNRIFSFNKIFISLCSLIRYHLLEYFKIFSYISFHFFLQDYLWRTFRNLLSSLIAYVLRYFQVCSRDGKVLARSLLHRQQKNDRHQSLPGKVHTKILFYF